MHFTFRSNTQFACLAALGLVGLIALPISAHSAPVGDTVPKMMPLVMTTVVDVLAAVMAIMLLLTINEYVMFALLRRRFGRRHWCDVILTSASVIITLEDRAIHMERLDRVKGNTAGVSPIDAATILSKGWWRRTPLLSPRWWLLRDLMTATARLV